MPMKMNTWKDDYFEVCFMRNFSWFTGDDAGPYWEADGDVEIESVKLFGHKLDVKSMSPELVADLMKLADECEREWE